VHPDADDECAGRLRGYDPRDVVASRQAGDDDGALFIDCRRARVVDDMDVLVAVVRGGQGYVVFGGHEHDAAVGRQCSRRLARESPEPGFSKRSVSVLGANARTVAVNNTGSPA